MTRRSPRVTRRAILQGGGALVIGTVIPIGRLRAETATSVSVDPNVFLKIAPDNVVTVLIKHLEMGQGPHTGLATVLAEELDADWSQIRTESSPVAPIYANTLVGIQTTGGSTSMAESYMQMRRCGAAARAMLVQAAANRWAVDPGELRVDKGVITHAASGRRGLFGEFTEAASQLPVPVNPPLKDSVQFRLIGKDKSVGRIDSQAKTNGTAMFGIDQKMPGMLNVVVARAPRFGSKVSSFDATSALAVKGVKAVHQLSSGIAVYATSTWAAMNGRKALSIEWDHSGAERRGSEEIAAEFLAISEKPGLTAMAEGNIDSALEAADEAVIEAEYVLPYLAHAPMEPLNGVVRWDGSRVEARFGSQISTLDQAAIAKVFGVAPELVEIKNTFAGGSFGRRATGDSHFAVEMAEAAKALGPNKPVKLTWTREDDITGGYYRPLVVHRMKGVVEGSEIKAWSDTIVSQSFMKGTFLEPFTFVNGVDRGMVEGAKDIPYDIAAFRCDAVIAPSPVSTLWWRSVGYSHNGYTTETFIDLLLEKAGKDPVAGRLELMGKTEASRRAMRVLKAVAEFAEWNGPGPIDGRARGVAVVESFGTVVAEIAEVSISDNAEPKVHRMWAAVDCGIAVNPDIVRAQIEGGIAFALGHILYAEVPLRAGQATVNNFDQYRSLRIAEMPEIQVTILPSDNPPSGIGEPGVPPCGPAVANALARLGQRHTRLPMVKPT